MVRGRQKCLYPPGILPQNPDDPEQKGGDDRMRSLPRGRTVSGLLMSLALLIVVPALLHVAQNRAARAFDRLIP